MAPARLLGSEADSPASNSSRAADAGFDHNGPQEDVSVLIVGGGPSGLLQARLLSQLGGKFEIMDRTEHCQLIK